jgi:hypothetical protein
MKRYVFILLLGHILQPFALATSVIIHVLPSRLSSLPISVQVADADFGKRFTVLYKTNGYTRNEFLQAQLAVSDADNQIAICPVEKLWTTNGVQFEFTVASAYLHASKFTLNEQAHEGKRPMPGFDQHWFYLRDFATNTHATFAQTNSNTVSPELLKQLPAHVRALPSGINAEQAWNQLHLTPYKNSLGGISDPGHERYWLSWNYELELFFEPSNDTNAPQNRRLMRAVLYKNGIEIVSSAKAN